MKIDFGTQNLLKTNNDFFNNEEKYKITLHTLEIKRFQYAITYQKIHHINILDIRRINSIYTVNQKVVLENDYKSNVLQAGTYTLLHRFLRDSISVRIGVFYSFNSLSGQKYLGKY